MQFDGSSDRGPALWGRIGKSIQADLYMNTGLNRNKICQEGALNSHKPPIANS